MTRLYYWKDSLPSKDGPKNLFTVLGNDDRRVNYQYVKGHLAPYITSISFDRFVENAQELTPLHKFLYGLEDEEV